MIENQYMDDRADLIEELPANLVTRLLKHVDENQRQVINQL
ncbi:MAG: magnesium transporter MgtE N-terminal domain-containing protein [Faecalibacillus faecis]